METIFAQLKQARESRHLTINDVAAATNINPEFLAAIEQGRTNILPQAYIRAFLREYASVVGLDPQALMEKYDTGAKGTVQSGVPPAEARETPVVAQPEPEEESPPSAGGGSPWTAVAAVATVLILGVILYWNFSRPPAQEVRKPAGSSDEMKPEPDPVASEPPIKPETDDSLRLKAQTTDTVWVQIIIDSRDSLDFILFPNSEKEWTATESFRVSVGRPEAVRFTLNQKEVGPLSTGTRIVRNVVLDRAALTRLRQGKQP